MARRTPLIAGNWKMNLLRRQARSYAQQLSDRLGDTGCDVVLFPPFPLLLEVAEAFAATAVGVGGQDLHPEPGGAHTGDVSGEQLADAGCRWVLCGHSERRSDHAEDDALVGAKLVAAWRSKLLPVLCLGETHEQRQAGSTQETLRRQLLSALSTEELAGLAEADAGQKNLVVAYEPVWAIGSGESATPAVAQEAHRFLRETLEAKLPDGAEQIRILYGGSVKPGNCEELITQPDVDGFLIGGASLDPEQFLDIIHCCGRSNAPRPKR